MLVTEFKNEDGSYNGKTIEIKQYLSFVEKKLLCIDILEDCLIVDENGLLSCDFFKKKLLIDLKLIVNYTDIEFSKEFMGEYDFLVEQGILDHIIENIPASELDFIDEMISDELDQRIKIGNSLESIIAKGINKIAEKLPTDKEIKSLSKSLVKDLNKFDWDKVPMLRDMWLSANGKSGQ